MVKGGYIATLVLVSVGGYLLLRRYTPPLALETPAAPIPGFRVDGIIAKEDVGTTKTLPIVETTKTAVTRDTSMSTRAKTADVIRFQTAPTALAKIKAAVKVLPKAQASELSSNLSKLGW